MNDEWKSRLGSDPWKNAIRRECDWIEKLLRVEEPPPVGSAASASRPGGPERIQFKESLEYESFELDQGAVAPFGQSYAVFQTGRFFLIGPTRRAVEKIEKVWLPAHNNTVNGEKHLIQHVHVILLCWDEGHWSGLTRLVGVLKARKIPMTIWSSYWIWEEVSGTLTAHDESKQTAASLLKAKFFGDDDRMAEAKADVNDLKVAAFETRRIWDLTCGVSVSLSYSLSSFPLLRAEFRCNNFRLVIDPGLLSLLRPGGTPLAGLLEQDGQTVTMDGGVPGRRTEVQESVNRTHSLLKQMPDLNNPAHESEERLERWRTGLLFTSFLGFGQPVDLLRPEEIQPFVKHPAWRQKTHRKPVAKERSISSEKSPAILTETVLVLLSGGLMDKVQRNLIDPSYQLDIRTKPGDCGAIQKMSVLEWRLFQIDEWYRDSEASGKCPLPVVLLTTPESEGDVRRLIAGMRPKVDKLDLLPACAQLIPDYQRDASTIRRRFEAADGGWRLHSRGHMDAVRFLVERNDLFKEKKVCLVVACNNLGDVFSGETLGRIRKFLDGPNDFGVELFEYRKNPHDTDRRWDQLSFCLNPNRPRLIKNSYLSNDEQVTDSPPRFYSSLTCYVRLAGLKEKDIREIGFLIDESGQSAARPRQDIDLITHQSPSSTMAFLEHGNHHSLYAYDRYLGVRTQDHVRHVAFTKKFNGIGVLRNHPVPPAPDLKDVPILEMIPSRQTYPWGGYEIATLKGDPPEMIAETWEVSAYPHAQSSVALDDEQTLLLQSALEKTRLPKCDIILKYLDCHGPLSLQVHPTKDTATYLAKERFPLRDEQGKEESFFVIDTAHGREFNLFLGFQKERLSELADAIRPEILRYVHQPESDSVKTVEAIVAAMRTVLRSSFLPKIAKFLKFLRDRSRKGPLLEDPQIEHFDEELSEKLGALFSERVGAAIDFHIVTGPNKAQPPSRSESLGKEFLLGGVAVIGLIEALRDYFNDRLRETKQSNEILDAARKLFGEDFQKGGDGREIDAHPLLSLFCRIKAEKDSWVRIPPGIVHGWQGGGNRLVEIGYTSDNTLRVLDFGREPDQAREMHYRQAMCALSPFSFFDQDSVQKLLGAGSPNPSGLSPCHDLLDYRLYHGERIEPLKIQGLVAYVMNPDGELTLTVTHPDHPPVRRTIGRMRTVLIHSRAGGTLELDPQQEDNRVLCLVAREAASPLLCLCPGGTDWEFALWRDQQLPAVQRVATPKKSAALNEFLENDSLVKLRKKCEKPRIALSWPGFVRRSADATEPERFYSTALGNPTADEVRDWMLRFAPHQTGKAHVLSDFHVSLLGEVRHPLGRLSLHEPGMLINVEAGFCLSFYHPDFHRDFRLDDLFHDNWLTVCSGIGRWLFVDSLSGQMTKGEGRLQSLVFCEKPEDTQGQRIRASKWFSAADIVTRAKEGNPVVTMEQIAKTKTPLGQSLAAKLLKLMDASGPPITETVIDLGEKLAGVVDFARKMLRGEFGFPEGLTTRLNGADLARLSEDCPRNIVLTGLVGQHFGRPFRRGREPFEDLLTWSLKRNLRGSHHVWRSDIGSVAERETEGFLFYLDYKDRQARKK